MNNEPVAWTKKDTLIFLGNYEFGSITIQVQKQKDDEFGIPLYTHPARTLTDEEIRKMAWNFNWNFGDELLMFARAILRKAQEK